MAEEACTCNFLSSVTGFAAGEIQYRNDLHQNTLFKVRKNLIKSHDKRQINMISNKTAQVKYTNCSLYIHDTIICTLSTLHAL